MANKALIALVLAAPFAAALTGCTPEYPLNPPTVIVEEGDTYNDFDIDIVVETPESEPEVEEQDECEAFEVYVSGNGWVETASAPVVRFDTTGISYPYERDWFSVYGDIFTAGGCGEGVVINDIGINVTNIDPEIVLTPAVAVLEFEEFTLNISCTPGYDSYTETQQYWCQAFDLDADPISHLKVLPDTMGQNFELRMENFPTFSFTQANTLESMDLRMFVHWTDIATDNGYQRNGWPVIDSDNLEIDPYYNYCSTTERRYADRDGDDFIDIGDYIQIGVCEPMDNVYTVVWGLGLGNDCDDNDPSVTNECQAD